MKPPIPSFTLKEPNSKTETLLNMKVYCKYKRITISTGQKVLPRLWDGKNGSLITDRKTIAKLVKEHPGISNRIKAVAQTINNYSTALNKAVTRLDLLGDEYDHIVLKNQILKELGKDTHSKKKITLNEFIETFIKEIEDGKRLTSKGKTFSNGTIKNYKGFQEQFKTYQKEQHQTVNFEDVTLEFRDRFVAFFIKKSYSPNTIWRHVKHLKSIMNTAFEEGLHSSMDFRKSKFMVPQVATSEIYLTEAELEKIYNLDLSDEPHYAIARDVFLVGCYTAQRYSDYSRISEEHIKTTPEGNKVISLTQVKTGTHVIVPIMPRLDSILRKYNYCLPKTHEQKVNLYIKKIVEKAEITSMEIDDVFTNGKRTTEIKPKHDLVKTHTARRSGATNMYLAGVPVIAIMKITGHKTEREFLKYIRITDQENADNLADHPYFK